MGSICDHELRGAGEAPGQLSHRLDGPFGVGETEGLQALDDRFWREELGLAASWSSIGPAAAVNDSSNGRKNRRSWIQRTRL